MEQGVILGKQVEESVMTLWFGCEWVRVCAKNQMIPVPPLPQPPQKKPNKLLMYTSEGKILGYVAHSMPAWQLIMLILSPY